MARIVLLLLSGILVAGINASMTLDSIHLLVGWTERETIVPDLARRRPSFHCYKASEAGKYCEYDLSGYFTCSPTGGETFTLCQNNKRCSCFSGPRCDDTVTEPCQDPETPPPIYHNTTTVSYGDINVDTNNNFSRTYHFMKQQYQAVGGPGGVTRRGDLQDTTWKDSNDTRKGVRMQSTYVPSGLPPDHPQYYKYIARLKPGNMTCNMTHPKNIVPLTEIPDGSVFDGYEVIKHASEGDINATRWKLVTGGSRVEDPCSVEYFYVGNCEEDGCEPIRYYGIFDYWERTGELITVNETFLVVKTELVTTLQPYALPPTICNGSPGVPQ